jgi:hypothetical protein
MDEYMKSTQTRRQIRLDMIRFNEHWLSKPKGEPRRGRFARCSLIGIALCLANILGFEKAHSVEVNKINHYRQWAFIQLNNVEQFHCLDELNYKESRWNPKAKNGSHHGIPQGRSKWLATVDGFKQIDWQLKYIKKRYSNPCNALAHHKIKGWY